jgi:hypothetical protein
VEGFEAEAAEAAAAAAADLMKTASAGQPIASLHMTVDTFHHEQSKTLLCLQPSLALASSFLSRWVSAKVVSHTYSRCERAS